MAAVAGQPVFTSDELTVIPTFAPYNQLLLIPALLLLAQRAPGLWSVGPRLRFCLAMVVIVILLPWLAAVGLDLSQLFLPQAVVERGWALPLWTSWAIPFPVLAAVALGAATSLANGIQRQIP